MLMSRKSVDQERVKWRKKFMIFCTIFGCTQFFGDKVVQE
jgi:hypothetical protein